LEVKIKTFIFALALGKGEIKGVRNNDFWQEKARVLEV